MTLATLRAELRSLGARLKVDDGEYAVTLNGSTYFTNDREDALNTARAMKEGR
jgi:hypothetical protein